MSEWSYLYNPCLSQCPGPPQWRMLSSCHHCLHTHRSWSPVLPLLASVWHRWVETSVASHCSHPAPGTPQTQAVYLLGFKENQRYKDEEKFYTLSLIPVDLLFSTYHCFNLLVFIWEEEKGGFDLPRTAKSLVPMTTAPWYHLTWVMSHSLLHWSVARS